MPKGTVISSSKSKIKPVAITVIKLRLFDKVGQSVSQWKFFVNKKVKEKFVILQSEGIIVRKQWSTTPADILVGI